MLQAERHQRILELLKQSGSLRVTQLSQMCCVTEETIRRDLVKLEENGQLIRSHGGAILANEQQQELSYLERESIYVHEKKMIAREAIKYIENKDTISLDASTTAWYVAKILPDIPITVLTNSVRVVLMLSKKENINVISTGGLLRKRSLSYVGRLTEEALAKYHVHKAFISCKAVHPSRGFSESNEPEAEVKKQMIKSSDQTIMLVDYSKFDKQAFAQVAPLDKVHITITNERVSPMYSEKFKEKKVQLIKVGLLPS